MTREQELAALIADQARDMRTGDRVWSRSVDEFRSGADIVFSRKRAVASDDRHGSLRCYTVLGCRCQECRAANATYMRGRRRRLPKIPCVDCGNLTAGRASPPRCQRCGVARYRGREAA